VKLYYNRYDKNKKCLCLQVTEETKFIKFLVDFRTLQTRSRCDKIESIFKILKGYKYCITKFDIFCWYITKVRFIQILLPRITLDKQNCLCYNYYVR
jgi:hypothetical protein